MVKVGGALDADMSLACADIQRLVADGASVVVVHGGGAAADRLGTELGVPTRYLTGSGGRRSRYTDRAALDVLTLGLLGRVKPAMVAALLGRGVRAVGLSGVDGGMVTATRNRPARAMVDGIPSVVRDDLSGRVASVDPTLPTTLLAAGYVPVVSPPALDQDAGPVNVDADRLAAALAVALGADWLVILSAVPGLLTDLADPASLVPRLPIGELDRYLAVATGRMTVKVRAAGTAFQQGVPNVVLADGRVDAPVLAARAGAGTRFVTREHDVIAS